METEVQTQEQIPQFKGHSWDNFHFITQEEVDRFELNSQDTYDSFFEEEKDHKSQQVIHKPKSNKTKKQKPQKHIKIRPQEEIDLFQQEEFQRYQNPTMPFAYTLDKDTKRVVAPACKKISDSNNLKAREHYLLKANRPPVVTLLSLVRDAAAKLPDGSGTRYQICSLLKESQYVNSEVKDSKMSQVVSGALDRLHYEPDPCVKFDIDKKLWIYLHIDKQVDDFVIKDEEISLKKMKTE